jgi:SSS family solute:Na+ symporter
MSIYLYIILAYLLVLMGFNFYRSWKVKTQDDFMVAGRSLSTFVMVFTLVCTWIGSGTFIAGAEFAGRAGFSALWMAAGAWVGIIIIYFLAAKIRTFGQYTIGDILEVRYGPVARVIGAIALIISFTVIVSYQFVAGGLILNVVTDGGISEGLGMTLTACFVILFTALAGMVAVAYTDLSNGIIILLACLIAVPFVVSFAGGIDGAQANLSAEHFKVINSTFGAHPVAKALSYFFSTLLLLLGVQSMYQKFYSAKTPKAAKKAVAWWVVGTIVVETVVVIIAVFAAASPVIQKYLVNPEDGKKLVLLAARYAVPTPVGVLLLAAAVVVVLSTSMNYLLSPSTNIMRDIYQRFSKKTDAKKKTDQMKMVVYQRVAVVILGIIAFFLAREMKSVLESAFFAYTIYGVAITPALIAALSWKRVTKIGGLVSITSGVIVTLGLKFITYILPEHRVLDGDPWGIPIIYPAMIISIGSLIIVSLLGKKPESKEWKPLFEGAEAKKKAKKN